MGRITFFLLFGLALLAPATPRAAGTYAIDQRFGGIAFTVRNFGLFSSHGVFSRFTGDLTIDEAHPEKTHIAVTIDMESVAMTWAEATSMLRSPPYFDVKDYPVAHFASTSVVAAGAGRYDVTGELTLRGVTQPLVLHAALVGRHPAPERGAEIAEFVVTGALSRTQFGMTADTSFVGDQVDLSITARVRLPDETHAD